MVLGLGLPIFMEKPVFHNLQDVEDILELIEKKKTLTYVGCNLRFLNCLRFIKDYVDKKDIRINEVNIYCGSYLPSANLCL